MALPGRLVAALAAALLAAPAAACGGGDGRRTPAEDAGKGAGAALGGRAQVGTLARAPLESRLPANAGWTAWRVTLAPGRRLVHRHAFSTVYAQDGVHTVRTGAQATRIQPRGGATVQAGRRHVHEATGGPSTFWDVLLAAPGAGLPRAAGAERVFRTPPLQGIPEDAEVAFLDVVLPPEGGQTTVHTHPGPETIYVMGGPFEYQNGIEGSSIVDEGELKSIPPDTPVQKRNPGDGSARFLSWFVVDPSEDFAPASRFPPER